MHTKDNFFFRKLVLLSILLIYLVIIAGGIVRSTGSGMGCPDWPKCFGQYVPPTDVSQLPPDYKTKFKVGNHEIAEFNVFKTWTEYINRLLGVLVGFSVFATFIYSFPFLKIQPQIFYLSLAIVVLTGFQGWIGAKVVATNLSKYMITVHMLIALVITALAIYLYYNVSERGTDNSSSYGYLFLGLTLTTLIQVLVGTQVRQEVDTIAIQYQETQRELWVNELGSFFSLHRILAIAVVALNGFASLKIYQLLGSKSLMSKLTIGIIVLLIAEYLFGVIMVRFAIPFWVQPLHLVLATMVFGLQFYAWLITRRDEENIVNKAKGRLVKC